MPEVKLDLQKVRDWYTAINVELLSNFREDLNLQLEYLIQNPEYFQRRYRNLRIINLKKFPYIIYYMVNEIDSQIVLFGILHNKRHPNLIQERMAK
ncbi:ParE-like toxin of type II ParDE toxin-antitoxin system [Nonlabens dokdonensis]|jgi:plasmid stabilization system protein ParE|uniref:Plasmid stabilization system n=2 Tax=Nonlabens dokdonensis TaxID=328515 RepID=L7W5D5_NONDD|nr:type II toxin-antitoxin system RelE/ParE family toxin [Nonlabens dokdonensis]AGC75387.1 hypothetical protein DDD_0260 [Nonlabens dokdonensis DSW-6]PZX43087.1 ParE-like toxin of type II ParDE toxin-antitoxin system [Nonlabens dokdonensis]